MQLLKPGMIDPTDYKIAGVATFFGFCAQQALAAYLALPVSLQTLLQGVITIALGCCVVTTQHFLRRYLKRNFPEDGASRIEETVKRVDWASVGRKVFAFIRRVIRRRKA